jgi:hypothetical protein
VRQTIEHAYAVIETGGKADKSVDELFLEVERWGFWDIVKMSSKDVALGDAE